MDLGGEEGDERTGYAPGSMQGAEREPYVGSRLGKWDEGGRRPGAAAEERAMYASSYGDDQEGGGGASAGNRGGTAPDPVGHDPNDKRTGDGSEARRVPRRPRKRK